MFMYIGMSAGVHHDMTGSSSVQRDAAVLHLKDQIPGQFGDNGHLVPNDESKLNQMLAHIITASDFPDDDGVSCSR